MVRLGKETKHRMTLRCPVRRFSSSEDHQQTGFYCITKAMLARGVAFTFSAEDSVEPGIQPLLELAVLPSRL